MEKISIGELPDGTTAKLKKQAKLEGFVKGNKEPHLSAWVRSILLGALKK